MESLELFKKLEKPLGEDVALELVQMHRNTVDLSKLATKDDLIRVENGSNNAFSSLERMIRISTWLIGILIALAVVIIKYA